MLISSPPLQARAGNCPRKGLVPGDPGQWSPRSPASLAPRPRRGDGVSERAALVLRPGRRRSAARSPPRGVWMPGAKDVHAREPRGRDCPPSDPGFCSPRLQSAPRPQPRAPHLRCPAATGTCGHALQPDPATRALHRPSARRSRRGAATPQPWAPGRSARVARPEDGGIRSPAGSGNEPPTGAGDPRGPAGTRRRAAWARASRRLPGGP